MSIYWYYRRMVHLLSGIAAAARDIHPSNRRAVNRFLDSWPLRFIDDMLAGLVDVDLWEDFDWDQQPVWLNFKDYITGREQRFDEALQSLGYNIDDENTLTLITGGGRPEAVSSIYY
jgi:hypothetical protein